MGNLMNEGKNFYRKRVSCFASDWMSFSGDDSDLLFTLPPKVLVKRTYAIVKVPGATNDKIAVHVNGNKIIAAEIPIGRLGMSHGQNSLLYFKNGGKVTVMPQGVVQTSPKPVFKILIEYIETEVSKGTETGGF